MQARHDILGSFLLFLWLLLLLLLLSVIVAAVLLGDFFVVVVVLAAVASGNLNVMQVTKNGDKICRGFKDDSR